MYISTPLGGCFLIYGEYVRMAISIFKFLSRYYGISLDAGMECSHTDIRRNFKFIKVYSGDEEELVPASRIIYVVDSHGLISPYVRPEVIHTSVSACAYTISKEDTMDTNISCVSGMSTYELLTMMSEYRDRPSFYRILKRELLRRGFYQVKAYKIEKEELKYGLDREEESYVKCKRRCKVKYKKP